MSRNINQQGSYPRLYHSAVKGVTDYLLLQISWKPGAQHKSNILEFILHKGRRFLNMGMDVWVGPRGH